MKNIVTLLISICLGLVGLAQEGSDLVQDQNPNYKKSLAKYTKIEDSSKYIEQQGTTVQQTYKAIDPLEEKRELKSIRKQYRAQRPYWRHQRRLEQAKNPSYYRGYNSGYYNNAYRGFYPRNNRYSNYNFGYNLLGLGLLGACAF